MAVDFPSSPALNQTYTYLGKTWQWDGLGWKLYSIAVSGGASVATSDTAPTSPNDGDLWYDSIGGRTYIYYDDGTTSQWVDAAPASGIVNPIVEANIDNDAVTYAKIQNVSATDKLLGRSTAGAGDIEEITCTAAGRALLDDVDAAAQRTTLGLGTLATQSGTFSGTSSGTNTGDQTITLTGDVTGSGTGSFVTAIGSKVIVSGDISDAGIYSVTTTATSKTLANRERCTVTAAGLVITLPASPSAGWEVSITVGGAFTDTLVSRNGSNIMSLAEDTTIDQPNMTVTFLYVNATLGWRII